eukprot:TRINITY_DN3170_c0_g1_i1.p1 TRINITY_DN3170_c0_g1~~TRINITY_DN3170_c0_g1_i1.p1  ORF type:complete len:1437 (+),score=406.88 TRINITY_DN3170_c0_g1_i1:264-4574(+)
MKRAREEGYLAHQVKRPATSCGEASAGAQLSRGPQKLTTDDALRYLKAVKDMFKDRKEKYDEFLEVMKEFKAQRIDTTGVIERVKELFKGHRDLILGFNTFLPKGYEITLPPEEEPLNKKQPVEFDQAINYVNKIKTRFQNDEHVYKAFLEILNQYRKGDKSIEQVYEEVASLFSDHPDLLDEFTCFLPDNSNAPHHSHPLSSARGVPMSQVCRDEKITGLASKHHYVEKKDINPTTHSEWEHDHDHNAERPSDHDMEKTSTKVDKDNKKRLEKEKERKDIRERRDHDGDEKDVEQYRERELSATQVNVRDKRRSAKKAGELIRKQTLGGEGGDTFAGHQTPNSSLDDKNVLKSVCQELHFVERVKARLRNHETYQEFLKCLYIYSEEVINRAELQSLVSDILGKYSDLMDGFNEFLSQCENIGDFVAGVFNKNGPLHRSMKTEKEGEKERDCDKEKDKDEREKECERERERERPDKSTSVYSAKDNTGHKVSSLPSKDKYMNKPISELDLSNCERCTPSYRLLPKNYPKLIASHRTDLGKSVLNDVWVSVTSGSEDYSFKHMRKNQYEESLFRCEDDRFELDMLLESASITAKRIEALLEKMKEGTIKQDGQIQIDDYLTALNLRCIERLYGDHGLDVVDLLRKNTVGALPVILCRLKQKQEEWLKCRTDMNKVWAEVYAKNYHKSLDHRSFYFKQQDKKSLSTKGLLGEIKEIYEKKRKEDDVLLAIAAGNRRLIIPNLQFEYSDPDIHEDLYQIIKYSCDEVCTTMDQLEKVMRVWTMFIEPMLGVPPRVHGAEDTEDAVKKKHMVTKDIVKGVKENDNSAVADVANTNGKHSSAMGTHDTGTEMSVSTRHRITNGGNVSKEDSGYGNTYNISKQDSGKSQVTSFITAGNLTMRALVGQKNKSDDLKTIGISATESNLRCLGTNFPLDQTIGENGPKLAAKSHLCPSEEAWNYALPERSGNIKADREEGELSPSPDTEDQQNAFADTAGNVISVATVVPQGKSNRQLRNRQRRDEEVDCDAEVEEHDADADDEGEESVQQSTEESENASEGAEEVSRSSRDADECSQDHEEEEDEDGEHEENDGKAESEGEAEITADLHDAAEGAFTSLSDLCLLTAKPLAKHVPACIKNAAENNSKIFYGNESFYVLFRLHQTLYERILSAKKNSMAAECKWKSSKDTNPPDLYAKFLSTLFSLLDGSSDNAKFEDECRAIIGTQSYVLFTLDKLIFKLVKQLQAIALDDVENKLVQLHYYESLRTPEKFLDIVYHANSRIYLHDENIYRFECATNPTCLSIQLMERGEKFEAGAVAMDPSFSNYLNNNFLSSVPDKNKTCNVFLQRNKRKYTCDDDYTSTCKAMKDVQVVNGLEYKITCTTSKVSYVLDTEDFLFRRKVKKPRTVESELSYNKTPHHISSKWAIRFNKWLEKAFHLTEKMQ